MYKNLLTTLRVSAGIVLLLLGIIGLFLPILQGWLFIVLAIPLISPLHGKKMIAWMKERKEKWGSRWRAKKNIPIVKEVEAE